MSFNLFNLSTSHDTPSLNIDELYKKKKERDRRELKLYNQVLNRIHARIKAIAHREKCCWYVIPEIILGVSRYDQASCIAFVMEKLNNENFVTNFTYPNLLFVSWVHWVPKYVREEYVKQTGIKLDGFGRIIQEINDEDMSEMNIFKPSTTSGKPPRQKKEFTPIHIYKKPTLF
jgi:hypothetical protein